MYIVQDKNSKEIIHKNPAPLKQQLTPKEVYARFDPDTMEIGAGDGPLPQHYKIKNGIITELTLIELVKAGTMTLEPGLKIQDNQVVEKTISEKVAEGLITLPPDCKITGEGANEQIAEKTTDEKVTEGLITLTPDQKVVGTGADSKIVESTLSEKVGKGLLTLEPTQKIEGRGEDEKIVEKTIQEQVADGTIQLKSNQKLDGPQIVDKTDREMLEEELITLDEYKQERLNYFSNLAFETRIAFLPDYKIQNAGIGVYDETKTAAIKNTVQAFKDEFNRIKEAIEGAADLEAIDAVTAAYPDDLSG